MRIKILQINFFIALFFTLSLSTNAQVEIQSTYNFKIEKEAEVTNIKSQDNTGTCWSYATSSFMESELLRKGKGKHDLSEMYVARNVYIDKATNYVLRHGKANFSQGSLAHDMVGVAKRNGVVPESVYSGLLNGEQKHNHSEMADVLKGMLDGILKQKRLSQKWMPAFQAVLDIYLGSVPEQFTYEGKSYTPKSFAESLDLNASDYVSLVSYEHHPFYESFVLEIPDNYSNGSFYNVPMKDLETIVDHAINNGFTVAWDGDVSEKGFSAKNGMAVLPVDESREDLFINPGPEKTVNQKMRQETFESYSTTDDHLMHLTGIAKDKKGTKYYLIKNSWGEIGSFKGYIYMSKPYFELKTVAIMVHKDAIPKDITKKITANMW